MARISLDALGGLHLNVDRTGDGPPVLAIHGFTGDRSTWESFSKVADGKYSVISVDLLGHGVSDAPSKPELYNMKHTVQALAEILDRLGIERVHWLGYSMGGRIALAAGVMLPDRTLSLMLESASPGLATTEESAERIRSDEKLADWIEQMGIEAFVEYWESLPLWASQARLPEVTRYKLRELRLSNNPTGLANSLRGIGTGVQPPLHQRLEEFRKPTLLIAGEEDVKFVEIAEQMHRAVTGSNLSMVKQSGHSVHLEQPEIFNSTVMDFLRTFDVSHDLTTQTGSLLNP